MSDIAGFDLTPDSGTTLRKMLKLELEQYMEQFEGISGAGLYLCCNFLLYRFFHPVSFTERLTQCESIQTIESGHVYLAHFCTCTLLLKHVCRINPAYPMTSICPHTEYFAMC